ncbi:MAG: tetratricopeptide repeat protein [Candidatus Cloacimonetes bacterium]|nr:tetratricopeptide repeat protein [Candidatus Cloacimonadota bacterium]
MSHSSSITPADHRIDLAIRNFLILVWSGLVVFGILTLIQPAWLQAISEPGRESEALDLKVQGDDFLKDNRFPEAIRKYELALETYPDLQTAMGNLAIAYARMGKLAMAEQTISELVKAIPERAWIGYLNLGDIYRERKDFKKARQHYLEAAACDQFPGNSYMFAGYCSMQLGETEQALEYYSQAIKAKTDFELLFRSSLKRDHYNYNNQENIANDIEEFLLLGNYGHLLEKYDEMSFHQITTRSPEIAKIYNDVGIIYYNNGNREQAAKYFQQAITIDPSFTKARQNLKNTTGSR